VSQLSCGRITREGDVAESPLDGQVAMVTGGASGIGRATVQALAVAGARVAVVDRDGDGAERAAREAEHVGAEAKAFVVDLADPDAIGPIVSAIITVFGRIDVLVNAAGASGGPHNALDFSDTLFESVINVNLRDPFLLTREIGKHMAERGGGGRIVDVSSSAAFRAALSPAVYAASKAGVNALTRASAADLGRYGVNVNAVAPGMTKTPMTAAIGDDAAYERVVSAGPLENLLHRVSEATDVANVIVFLCLPESRQVTGQVVHTSAGVVV
jgi:NAD(P)-dependent dehydrogenase (short-subunit alcohol dehydrogenase family)